MPRYALHGELFSGKSTLASALEARGFAYVNYTQYLKILAARSLSAIGIPTTVAMIEANKEEYRAYLIALGTRCGFDQGNFVEECLRHDTIWEDDDNGVAQGGDGLPKHIVFDNVRFPAQFEKLIPLGFRLVRLSTPYGVRLSRAEAKGLSRADYDARLADKSETPLPEYPGEISLSVNGPTDALVDTLAALTLYRERCERIASRALSKTLARLEDRLDGVAPR